MPRRQTSSGGSPSMRPPWNVMVPSFGANTPAIRLNSVVLPAPFGPITAKIESCGTVKLTPATARSPWKFFVTPATSRSAPMSHLRRLAPLQTQQARDRRPDAVRQQHHDQQKADAVEQLRGAWRVDAVAGQKILQTFRKTSEHERADHRTEQGADAADHRAEDDLDRAADEERLLRE